MIKHRKRIPPVTETSGKSDLANNHIRNALSKAANCSFSLKYLDTADKDFVVKHNDASYYHKVIERLQALSITSVDDLMHNRSSSLRCHPIDWSETGVSRNKFGISREEELCDKPYQVAISKNLGRLHGFFTGDIFNIVWFDKDHLLYPGRKND